MSLSNENNPSDKINYQTDVNEIITTVSNSYNITQTEGKQARVDEQNDEEDREIRRKASNLADRIMSDIQDINTKERHNSELDRRNNAQVIEENIGKVKQIRKMFDKPHSLDQFQIGSTFQHRKVYYSPSPAKTDSLPRPPPVDQLEKQTQEIYKVSVPKSASVLQIRHMFETRDIANIMNRSNSNIDITSETKIECISPESNSASNCNNYNKMARVVCHSYQEPTVVECHDPNHKYRVHHFEQRNRSMSPIHVHSTVKFQDTCPHHNVSSLPRRDCQNQYTAHLVKSREQSNSPDNNDQSCDNPPVPPFRSRSLSRSPNQSRARSGSLTQRCISPVPINYTEIERRTSTPRRLQQEQQGSVLTEPLEKPVKKRDEIQTFIHRQPDQLNYEKSLCSYESKNPIPGRFPDGVYVRTGEVYEKMDNQSRRGPLGHWITTVVNKKPEETPITQVTNIWMNSDERPSRDRLILTENGRDNLNEGTRKSRSGYRSSRSKSGVHSPICHSNLRWPYNDVMPPYRTQHLRSWGSEANCSSVKQQPMMIDHFQPRSSIRNVQFERHRSPTPLFHSPEQVERRIQELKAYRNGDRPTDDQIICHDESGRGQYLSSTSTSPCLGKRVEMNHCIRFSEPNQGQQMAQIESGIDCSPISNDFQNKCAYFEDFSREPREVFLSSRCNCPIHCPKIYLQQTEPMKNVQYNPPKRSASVSEVRTGEHPNGGIMRYSSSRHNHHQPQTIRQFKRATLQSNPTEVQNYTVHTIWRPSRYENS